MWVPEDSHGDYNPTCTNATVETHPVTPAPRIPTRDASCDAADFEAFAGDADYTHKQVLTMDRKFVLLWNVSDGLMHGKLAYNGRAGWMALGTEKLGGRYNGMCGSHNIMGIHDPDPDVFGAPYAPGVHEYIIAADQTAFRHWKDPAPSQNALSTSMSAGVTAEDQDDCFTSMTFVTAGFAGIALNLTAGEENRLIWGVHSDTFLKGYHGFMNRGHLHIDLAANELVLPAPPSPPPSPPDAAVVSDAAIFAPPSGAVQLRATAALAATAAVLALLLA